MNDFFISQLYAEMERMKVAGICAFFRQAWMEMVPAIIEANTRESTTIILIIVIPLVFEIPKLQKY